MVVAQSIRDELSRAAFNLVPWSRGVDITAFRPRPRTEPTMPADLALCRPPGDREEHQGLPRPRPARHQVGGGRRPQLKNLNPRFRTRLLRLGRRRGAVAPLRRGRLLRLSQPHRHVRPRLARGAGLGVPVQLSGAGPARCRAVPGVGAVDEDLRAACLAALRAIPTACRRHAETFTWASCAAQFLATLCSIPRGIWHP